MSGVGFVRSVEELTWSDLTTRSQEKLLEKSVTFQGTKLFLNQLMSAESPAAKFLSLGALLEERQLKIANEVSISNGYNESYFIGRTFRNQRAIKQEIFSDKDVKEKHVFLANTEQEFKQLCQLHRNGNVHWLEKDETGKLVWQQSQGSLKTLHRYIDTDSSHTYTADALGKMLEQAQHQRVMLISDTAGMGKSTILTHLSKQIKQKFPAKWVVRVDLNDHTDALMALKKEQIDKEKAIEFVSEKLLKFKSGLEVELFKQCCGQNQKVGIVIMLDGFDEISPSYKDTAFDVLQALRQTAVEQLWVTTRPHLRNKLEDKLRHLSYTLQPFSEENQVDFLTKYWSLKNWFTEGNSIVGEEGKMKLQVYAKELIKKLCNSISDKDRQFTGIPLQTRMLAEVFDTEVKTFYRSAESMPELQFQLDLLGLYGRFIERKYDIYQEEKFRVQVNNVVAKEQRERDVKSMREDHQLLALKVLFTEEQVALIQTNRECNFLAEQLSRIGIVQVSHDNKPHFIHRTFAEYYVADCLVNSLTEGNNTSEQVQTFVLEDVFQKEDYRVVRVFMDGLLSKYNPTDEVLKEWGNRINDFGGYAEILHRAADEGIAKIFGFVLDSAEEVGHREEINKILLGKDKRRENAWIVATERGNIEVIKKIWEWAQEKLTTEEIKNEILLRKDDDGETAWKIAALWGRLDVMQKIWEWAKEKLTTEEIKHEILLRTDIMGWTAWKLANLWRQSRCNAENMGDG
jgi:hypothetical protein